MLPRLKPSYLEPSYLSSLPPGPSALSHNFCLLLVSSKHPGTSDRRPAGCEHSELLLPTPRRGARSGPAVGTCVSPASTARSGPPVPDDSLLSLLPPPTPPHTHTVHTSSTLSTSLLLTPLWESLHSRGRSLVILTGSTGTSEVTG